MASMTSPQQMDVWYGLWKSMSRHVYSIITDGLIVNGYENYISGPKIVIINHPSASDYFLFPNIFQDRLSYLVDKDILFLPLFGWFNLKAGHIPVGHETSFRTIDLARKRLSEGCTLVIALEGRITPTERLVRPRIGAALLALEEQVPIIPCAIYTPPSAIKTVRFNLFNRERTGKLQLGGHSVVQIGTPWTPTVKLASRRDWHMLRTVSQDLLNQVNYLVELAQANYVSDFEKQLSF